MGKEAFVCPICGKESRYGYALADGEICSDCETIAEPFLEGLDGGDLYDPSDMTVELIRKFVQSKTEEKAQDLSGIPKLPQRAEHVEKPPCCPICGSKFKLLNMSMRILDTYICVECFNKAQAYEDHKRCCHGMYDMQFHDLAQFRQEVAAVDASDAQTDCAVCGKPFENKSDYLWLADDSKICRSCANRARANYPFVTVREKRWRRTMEPVLDSPVDQDTYIEWEIIEETRDPIADLTLSAFQEAIGASAAAATETPTAEVYRTRALFKNIGTYAKPKYTGQKQKFVIDGRLLSGQITVGRRFHVTHGDRTFDYTVSGLLEWHWGVTNEAGRDIQKVDPGMFFAMVVDAPKIMIFPGDVLTFE